MEFLKKEWKDRIAEYINRRMIVKEDGSSELVTVERNEGTISQEGDAFNSETMNDLEQRISDTFAEVLYVVSFDSSTGTLITKSADYTG